MYVIVILRQLNFLFVLPCASSFVLQFAFDTVGWVKDLASYKENKLMLIVVLYMYMWS